MSRGISIFQPLVCVSQEMVINSYDIIIDLFVHQDGQLQGVQSSGKIYRWTLYRLGVRLAQLTDEII